MSLTEETTLRIVLYEGSGSQPWPGGERFALVSALLRQGYPVSVGGRETVTGMPRRSVLVLGHFESEGATPSSTGDAQVGVHFRNITGLDLTGVLAVVEESRSLSNAARPGEWKPWFPVIDYARCTNCLQCLSFCLFGVYAVDQQQRIAVQFSENCKTNCPACSRVCPEAAIMFPKYKSGPINGDAIRPIDLQGEKMKVNISSLLGGDVYSMLRARSERAQSRFSMERDAAKALEERKKCLTRFGQAAEIPPEVLMSLPAPEEIARRAEAAKAKAQAALEKRRKEPEANPKAEFRDPK
jgi:Pyruvate/2-oxoacid:ferredoxin oxidoreductase delta subunit